MFFSFYLLRYICCFIFVLCVVFGRSLFVLFRFAVLLAVLLGFTVSDYTCDVSDYTCDVSDYTCDVSDYTCDVSDYTCDVSDYTCDVSDYTCDVSDYTCDIFKHFLVVPLTP